MKLTYIIPQGTFHFNLVNKINVLQLINKLKNKTSYGHDSVSNKLLKLSKDILVKPLTLLINQTLSSGIFPSQLKISRVKPLFKSGDKSKFSNYRPISLLPSLSKIFEYAIFNQLFDYFTRNKLFCVQQYGFRAGHSTELAALRFVDQLVKQMDKKNVPISIFIDLSKAFDTLDHRILLSKLDHYGICGNEHALFTNYLSDRHQYVEYNDTISATNSISTGVPQGSILGPLLFLIYINDLPLVTTVFDMLKYADDTTLYCNISQNIDEFKINRELEKITVWLASNKLSLNVKKNVWFFTQFRKRLSIPL